MSIFTCETFEGGSRYLRQDLTIDCDSPFHQLYMKTVGVVLIILYPVGVPVLYAFVIWAHRRQLRAVNSLVAMSERQEYVPFRANEGVQRAKSERSGFEEQVVDRLASEVDSMQEKLAGMSNQEIGEAFGYAIVEDDADEANNDEAEAHAVEIRKRALKDFADWHRYCGIVLDETQKEPIVKRALPVSFPPLSLSHEEEKLGLGRFVRGLRAVAAAQHRKFQKARAQQLKQEERKLKRAERTPIKQQLRAAWTSWWALPDGDGAAEHPRRSGNYLHRCTLHMGSTAIGEDAEHVDLPTGAHHAKVCQSAEPEPLFGSRHSHPGTVYLRAGPEAYLMRCC
eukprot:1850568-Prymnesium_polylepis.1